MRRRSWLVSVMLVGCGRIDFGEHTNLAIAPHTARSNVSSLTQLSASGGAPPYTFSLDTGDGEVDASTGAFRAAAYPGTASVKVTDTAGATDTADLSFGGELLYFMGGFDTVPHNDIYRSADGATWQLVGHLPAGRIWGHLWVYDDAMYYAGGDTNGSGGSPHDEVWRSTDGVTWSQIGTLPVPLGSAGVAVFHGRMWLVGGSSASDGFVTSAWSSADGATWRPEAPFPVGIHGSELVTYEGRLWSFAGHVATGESAVAFVTGDGVTWTPLPPVPAAGEYHATTVANGKMWIAGGLGLQDRVVSSSDGATWQDADRLFMTRTDGRMVELGGELWIVGGTPPQATHSVDGVGWVAAGALPLIVEGGRLALFTPPP